MKKVIEETIVEENGAEALTPLNSGFRPETMLDVTSTEFALLAASIEQLFESNIKVVRPIKYKYWDPETGDIVLSPKYEDIQSGKVRAEFDPLSFMSANNLVEAFVGDPSPVIMEALRSRFVIHDRGIEAGKAVLNEVLMAEIEKSKNEQ